MPTKEQTILLLQRELVLVGSMCNFINIERNKIACSRINPALKSLAGKNFEKHQGKLFGPQFLERVSKKMEAKKAMLKVINNVQCSHK